MAILTKIYVLSSSLFSLKPNISRQAAERVEIVFKRLTLAAPTCVGIERLPQLIFSLCNLRLALFLTFLSRTTIALQKVGFSNWRTTAQKPSKRHYSFIYFRHSITALHTSHRQRLQGLKFKRLQQRPLFATVIADLFTRLGLLGLTRSGLASCGARTAKSQEIKI